MITIYKYAYDVLDEITIYVPDGAELLDVQDQHNQLAFWFLVDNLARLTPRTYYVYGTGHPVDIGTGVWVSTVQQFEGTLVWHIFEKVTL